jgi:hypothetical protein
MPLNRQVISIPMTGALDTKTDPKQLPMGKMLELENGFRLKNGELQKRYGYEALTNQVTPSGVVADGRKLALFGNELNVITNKSMYTYSDDNDNWVLKGPLETLSVNSQPVVANSYQQTTADSGTAGSFTLYAWEDSRATNQLRYSIIDRSSTSVIVGDALLANTASKPHVIGLSNKLFVFYRDVSLNRLVAKIFDITNPTQDAALVQTVILGSDFNTTGNMDIIEFNSAILFTYHTSTPSLKVGYISRTGVVGNGTNGLPGIVTYAATNQIPSLCLTLFANDSTRFSLAWANLSGANYNVYHMGLYPDLTSIWLPTLSIASYASTAGTNPVRNITGFHSATLAHIYWDKDNTDKWRREVTDTHRNLTSGVVTAGVGNLKSVSLAGKAFYTDDNGFIPVTYFSTLQPTLFLLRNDGDISAKMLAQRAAGETAKTGHLPNAVQVENGFVFSTPYKQRIVTENAVLFGLLGIIEVRLDFNDQFICDSAQLGANLQITSGYLQCYDGVSIFESGFHIYPDHITPLGSNIGGTRLTAGGSYQYAVVYEWSDNQGQIHRSAPGIVPIALGGSENKVTLTIPTLHITDRRNGRAAVVIAIYRTRNAGTLFFKVSSTTVTTGTNNLVYNDPSVFTVTFEDILPDTSITGNEQLYTTGGVLENISPPAGKIIARYKNRLFLAGLEAQNTMWYSKEHIPSEAINFSDVQIIQVDDTGGAITSLGELDDKLIIFKATTIFAMNGDGPLPTGAQNTFSIPQLITSDVGCIDPYSVVRTRNGLMFKSKKGIYLLDRSLQVQYIGSEVEQYNNLTITSASVVDDQNQVRFTTIEGRCLVYDIFFQQWYTFSNINALDSAMWQGRFIFLKSNADVWRETKNVYLDVDVPIISKYVLALMQFGQVQGFQRIFKLNILGENRGTHGLKIEVGYDYREFYEERFVLQPDDVLYSSTWGSDDVWGEAGSLWGGPVDGVYQFQIRPRQQRCQALKLKIEDFFGSGSGTAGFALSNVTAEIGVEPNIARLAKTKIIAP